MIDCDAQSCRVGTAVLRGEPHAVLRSLRCACAGLVNVEDLIPLLGAYGKSGAAAGKYDIVKTGASNGKVDVEDLLLLLKSFGATNCMKPGAPAPPPAGTPPPPPVPTCKQGQNCGGQVQMSCGSACPKVCGKPAPAMCVGMCVQGYFCPPNRGGGMWWEPKLGKCVNSISDCASVAPTVQVQHCPSSPMQRCRRMCPPPTCPAGQCAMRTDGCCAYKCSTNTLPPGVVIGRPFLNAAMSSLASTAVEASSDWNM